MLFVDDEPLFLRSVGTAHQFLPKSYRFEELRRVIDQALGVRAVLANQALMRLVSQVQSLSNLPSLYLELVEELRSEVPSST